MVDGNKIKALREQRGIREEDLGKAVYTSQTMISYIELGIKNPSVELLKRIADYFECTVDELLTDQPAKDKAANA